MATPAEIRKMRRRLAEYEKNSHRTGWLLKRLGKKIAHFPRDLSRRLRHSMAKRGLFGDAARTAALAPKPGKRKLVRPGQPEPGTPASASAASVADFLMVS